jgi:hypothetical protein
MSRRLLITQLSGYLVLLALVYLWLAIADRSAWQIILTALLGVGICAAAVWLLGDALAGPPGFPRNRYARFLLWALAGAAIVLVSLWLSGLRPRVGVAVASRLTLWFRRPVKPQAMGAIYAWLVRVVCAAALLAVLPFASQAAGGAKRTAAAALRHWRYWAGTLALLLAGICLPVLLAGWIPKFQSLPAQAVSMLLRFALAYVIAVAAWLEIAALARRYRSAAGG